MAKTKIEQLAVKAALRIIQLDRLQTDPSYQREVREKHKTIISNYVPEALGIPLVAQRDDGSLWIVDGLQRVTALRKMGRHKHVRAEVFPSKGPEHEAEIFRLVNANRSRLSPGELFRASLTEGDELAWQIKDAVEKCGFRLKLGGGKNVGNGGLREVSCINTLIGVAREHGTEPIVFALEVVKKAWDNDPNAAGNYVIAGLAKFYAQNEGVVDLDRLVPRLQTSTPAKIIYSAGLGNWAKAEGVCNEIARLYRKRLGKRA